MIIGEIVSVGVCNSWGKLSIGSFEVWVMDKEMLCYFIGKMVLMLAMQLIA